MQTIGVLGGFGPQATTHFENRVNEEARRLLPPDVNRGYPPMVTVHLRHPPILIADDGTPVEPLVVDPRVLEAARRLGAWADFLVIVANTPHLFVDEIARAAGRDVLSMVDLVTGALERRPDGPVGLLGLGVPQAYVDRFAREGVEVVTAPPGIRERLDEAIFRMLEGTTTDAHRRAAHDAVAALRAAGAAKTVLGCTEIPLLLGEEAVADDLVDPGELLVRAAVERAVRGAGNAHAGRTAPIVAEPSATAEEERGATRASGLPEHVVENRRYWNAHAEEWVAPGERAWRAEPSWGSWGVPERELEMLPGTMAGLDAIELGCGTAYVSAWLARRGARVVGVDTSERQLATARRLARAHGVALHLVQASAEQVPCPDGAFDFAVSEYGAAIWCDPYVWIPEARRLLKPGGELVFLGTTPLVVVCTPPDGSPCEPRLHRDYFGTRVCDWRHVEIDPGGVEFNLTMTDWLRLFRETGFEVLDYRELRAPETASGTLFAIPAEWARRWPSEQIWKLRRRG